VRGLHRTAVDGDLVPIDEVGAAVQRIDACVAELLLDRFGEFLEKGAFEPHQRWPRERDALRHKPVLTKRRA
jgi:hypothetical protein